MFSTHGRINSKKSILKSRTSPDFADQDELVAFFQGTDDTRHVAPGLVVKDQLVWRHWNKATTSCFKEK